MPNDLLRLLASRRARRALRDALARSLAARAPSGPLVTLGRRVARRVASGPLGRVFTRLGASRAARGVFRAAWRVPLALLALFVGWAFANVASRRPVPPAPWSASELPADPPAEQNGWHLIRENGTRLTVPREVDAMLKSEPGALWPAASAGRSALERFLDEAATRQALDRYEAAIARPRFTDAYRREEGGSGHFQVLMLHRVGAAEALRRALRGELAAAFALDAAMLRADLDFAATATSALARGVASANLQASLALSWALIDALDAAERSAAAEGAVEPGRVPARVEVMGELGPLLGRLSARHFDLRGAIIAENLFLRSVMPGGAAQLEDGPLSRSVRSLFFDPGSTLEAIDARDREVMAHVSAPPGSARPLGAPRRAQEGLGWWLLNPVGDALIDGTSFDWAAFAAKTAEARATSFARRDALLSRLARG